ncbi:MAG: glycogen synthase [Myxococcota bacterium]
MVEAQHVVHVAAEHADLLHTGGLGEVMAGLPAAQVEEGAVVRVVLPGYRAAQESVEGARRPGPEVHMPWGPARFDEVRFVRDGVEIVLLAEPAWFDRPHAYGPPGTAYSDNPVRFAAFSRAVAAWIAEQDAPPDVVHVHDWHAGLVAPLLEAAGVRIPVVCSVHNLAYQGAFPTDALPITGLPPEYLRMDGILHHDAINPLKAGLQFADVLATVSPTYARELTSDEGGWDLAPLFRWRREHLVGIVNGIRPPGPRPKPEGLAARRRDLCESLGIASPTDGPLFGMVSRLTGQKGVDLFVEAAPRWIEAGCGAVILGSGERRLADGLRRLARAHPDRVAFVNDFDPGLAARIYAGVDVVCVPSRFEPCGMVQLHAMYAGAVPLVRRTGGLADTVRDVEDGGWGFVFEAPTPEALSEAMGRAQGLWRDGEPWAEVRARAMARPVGWREPARRYLDLYESLAPARPR